MSRSCIPLLLFAVLAISFGFPHFAPAGKDAKSELELLQGKWKCIDAEYNGATLNNRYPLAIKGSEFKWVFLIDGIDGKLTLDHTKKPKAIDFKITGESDHPGPSHKGKTLLGIYKIEGDKLFVYYHHKTRPTEFETRTGNHVIGYVYQREK